MAIPIGTKRRLSRAPATMAPQSVITPALAATARSEVEIARVTPTSRSSSSGKETTLIAKANTAKKKPTPTPAAIIVQPPPVWNTLRSKAATVCGGVG